MTTETAVDRIGMDAPDGDRRVAAPRRVTMVGPLPPPSGGMANQTRQLARLLGEEGCAVTVVQTNAPYRPAAVGRLPVLRALFRLLPYLASLWREVREADVVHVMANSGWAWHLFAAPAVWIASLRGAPVVVNYRGGEAGAFFNRQIALIRPTLARAREVIVPSGFLREVFARHGVATTEVPNIVDLAAFSPAASPPPRPHVLVTRNLEPIYDVATALRAFAIVRERWLDATMTVAGSGPEREALERLAAELRIAGSVRFTGRLDNRELPQVYRSASVALNASLVDNMPISLLEAMASGVPIVSTNVGGVPYMVRDGHEALLVPPGDPQSMAQAILRLCDDPALARRLAEQGLAAARGYAWTAVAPRLFDVYARSARAPGMAQA